MSNQNSNRGRNFSFNRNRSNSRSRGGSNLRGRGKLGFFNQATVDEEQKKLDDVRADVTDLKQFVETNKQKDLDPKQQTHVSRRNERINNTIEKGKEFVSKFFRGFVQPDRGNIKVSISPQLPSRLTNPYIQRILTYTHLKFQHDPIDESKNLYHRFHGIVEIALAIKLFRSSTEFERNLNFKFSSIRNTDVPLPKKLNVLMNQVGKTDLLNDNRIRIKHQHLLVKRFLLRGCLVFLQKDTNQYLKSGVSWKHVLDTLNDSNYFDKTIDQSINSLDLLKKIGKEYFMDATVHNYDFKIDKKLYTFRLPFFDFEGATISSVAAYFSNAIFTDFKFDESQIGKIIGSLVFQVANYRWLRNRDKTMEELDTSFADSVIAGYKFNDILVHAGVTFIEDWIDEDTLDDVSNEVIRMWKTGTATHFNQMFNMEEIKFSEFGTDAQMIQVDQFKKKNNEFGDEYYSVVNRTKTETFLKTTEHGAILGSILGFSSNVEFTSKFIVNYDSKNDQILQEFLKTDFKM